jgi:alpha-tubulin suppressor-like RCC1 family protein
MAWCSPDFTVVRVGSDDEGKSKLKGIGKTQHAFTTKLLLNMQNEVQLRTLQLMQRFNMRFNREVVQVAFGHQHVAIVSAESCLFTAGDNSWGELGRPGAGTGVQPLLHVNWSNVVSVACGEKHMLVVCSSNQLRGKPVHFVWGCGSNFQHQLRAGFEHIFRSFEVLDISATFTGDGTSCGSPVTVMRVAAGRDFSVVAVRVTVGAIGTDGARPASRPLDPA